LKLNKKYGSETKRKEKWKQIKAKRKIRKRNEAKRKIRSEKKNFESEMKQKIEVKFSLKHAKRK
jgi:hypothetical protein